MKRGIFSLSPIPTIDIMTTFSTEKKNKIKMKKRKKIKLNEEEDIENNLKTEKHFYKKASIFNKYNINENNNNNNSQSKTKDISYHSISKINNNSNNNNGNIGYFFKSLLSQKNDNLFSTNYYNEKFTNNLNEGLNKLINDNSTKIFFEYITKTNNSENNNNNNENNENNFNSFSNKRSKSNYNNSTHSNLFSERIKTPIILNNEEKKLDFETLNKYYENLSYSRNSNITNYKTISNFKNINQNNELEKNISNYNNLTSRARRVSMKSVIDRIEDIEKRQSIKMNLKSNSINNNIFNNINENYKININSNINNNSINNNIIKKIPTLEIKKIKKGRKIYPELRRVSQFDLIPKVIQKKHRNSIFTPPKIRNKKKLELDDVLIKRNNQSKTYRLPENLLEVKQRLQKGIKKLVNESLKSNFNITNDQILFSLEKTQKSEYTKDIIEKIKLINNYLLPYPKEKFESDLLRHRKIYVIIDGTVVFNEEIIKGNFIDIPTRRYLSFLDNKKDRLEEYYKFLSRCQREFRSIIPYKNIFLINGINIFDLIEIPDSDNAIFVSTSNIFRGIHLFWDDIINTENVKKKDYNLLKIQECKKALVKIFNKTKKNNNKKKKKRIIWGRYKKKKKVFKTYIFKKKYIEDTSFTFGLTDIKNLEGEEKFYYYSEDEKKKKKTYENFKKNNPSLLQRLIYFNETEMKNLINSTNKKNEKKLEKFLSKRVNEETFNGLNYLMRQYNTIRGKRDKIIIHQNMKSVIKKMQNELKDDTNKFFSAFLQRLNILNKRDSEIEIEEERFYNTEKKLEEKLKKSIIHKNIIEIKDMAHHVEREINKYYPDLISMNIPAVLKTYPKLKRRIFYDIFIQFKNLLTLCVCVTKNIKQLKKGLDFSTFFNCLPQMKSQGKSQALKLYKTLNKLNTDYLNWEEFMQGMLSMKSNNISDKIDIFFHVIDSDGNGLLSFDEVYEISKKSLQRTLGDKNDDDDEVVNCLASYFANLIFQLVDMDIDQEIPMDKIKEKILEGQSAAGYLEMFICADSFT